MAIAEAEPKKSEVAVSSAGVSDGLKDKVLNAGKNFVRHKGYASSSASTSGTTKKYNLYNNIKGFRFEMPDGWNDEDIGLFVACCSEKQDDFSKGNIDKNKIWADIAQAGAKKSKNLSLFTVNSCLELAERINYYVSKNKLVYSDNIAFMTFYSDVKGLLHYFSDNFVTSKVTEDQGNRKKVKGTNMNESTSELLNNDLDLGDMILDLTIQNAVAIRNGNPNVWGEMSDKLKEILGINTDSKSILEIEKNKIISDVKKMEEKGIDRKEAFIDRAKGFIEVFDYLTPKQIKVSDYLSTSVDSTMNDNDVGKERRLDNILIAADKALSTNKESSLFRKDDNDQKITRGRKPGRPLKYKKAKNTNMDGKTKSEVEVTEGNQDISAEPSSTTSFDEMSQRDEKNELESQNRLYISKSSENLETHSFTKKVGSYKKLQSIPPRRIMPAREARSKVVSYSLRKNSVHSKNTANRIKGPLGAVDDLSKHNRTQPDYLGKFKGNNYEQNTKLISDSDCDDVINGIKRIKSTKNNSREKINVANPDTTTSDLCDSINSINAEVPYLKKSRKRKDNLDIKEAESSNQENLRAKVRVVHADSTMKNLVVKLFDCQQEKTSTFGNRMRLERSKEDRLIEETVVMAKDVVDSEYNPNSDSAKLVSSEHLNKAQRTELIDIDKWKTEQDRITFVIGGFREGTNSVPTWPPASNATESTLHSTKHHVSPFCEGSSSASADMTSSLPVNRSLNFCSQDNSVSPYNSIPGTSGQLETNQRPSTSSGNPSVSNSASLEGALATLKQCKNQLLTNEGNIFIANNSMLPNRLYSDSQDVKLPDWFGNFVTDFRKHEAWKIQQFLKMQQELANVEHRKVLLLEKILGSLVNQ